MQYLTSVWKKHDKDAKDLKLDKDHGQNKEYVSGECCKYASEGDINGLQAMYDQGANINLGDYDLRTAVHLAASEGQLGVIEWMDDHKLDLFPRDRWGNTPIDDAQREMKKCTSEGKVEMAAKYQAIFNFLQEAQARQSTLDKSEGNQI